MLVYFQGLKYREAAQVLSLPVGTVKSRLHTAVSEAHGIAFARELAVTNGDFRMSDDRSDASATARPPSRRVGRRRARVGGIAAGARRGVPSSLAGMAAAMAPLLAAWPDFEPPPGLAERTCRLVAAFATVAKTSRIAATENEPRLDVSRPRPPASVGST